MDNFLKEQSADGEESGQGVFTLATEESLRKLAAFQLPFEGAWLLKVLQALVASGTDGVIDIALTKTHIEVNFKMPQSWTREKIAQAFLTPVAGSHRDLQHLVTGLRPVALHDKREFVLSWPNGEQLHWDGESLHFEDGEGCATLRVVQPKKSRDLISFVRGVSKQNAALTKVLEEHAFTCPVPLRLEGRRVDCLTNCSAHGVTDFSRPLALFLPPTDLPKWTPPRRFWQAVQRTRFAEFKGVNRLLEETPWAYEAKPSVVALVIAHLRISRGESIGHFVETHHSNCYWVDDGVVIQKEKIGHGPFSVSMGLFLSANELGKDMTTLSLLDSESKKRHLKTAIHAVEEDLQQLSIENLISFWEREASSYDAWFHGLGGAAMAFFTIGLKPIALPVMGLAAAFGVASSRQSRKDAHKKINELQSGLSELQKDWKELL